VIQEDAHVLWLRQHRIITWLQEKVETSMPHWEPVEEHDVTDEAHLQVAGRVGPVVAFFAHITQHFGKNMFEGKPGESSKPRAKMFLNLLFCVGNLEK